MPEGQDYNFSNRELRFSYWYVTNKIRLRKFLISFLILISFLLFFYVTWQLSFFGFQYEIEQYKINRLIFRGNEELASLKSLTPSPFRVSDLSVFDGENNRNDYLVQLSNPNNDWMATFDYNFNDVSNDTYSRKGFIFPSEQKFLMDLGIEGAVSGLDISNIKWQRVPNFNKIYNERYRFSITNEEFIAGLQPGDPNRLVFDFTNHSAYSYWQTGVQAFLYSGSRIVSINYIVLDQLKSGETRRVELNWNTLLPRISSMKIIPDINILDNDNIMPPIGEADIPIF